MKKSAREVLRNWGDTVKNLKPGEVIEVTSRGKPTVHISKPARRRRLPDFAKIAKDDDLRAGNRLVKHVLAELE